MVNFADLVDLAAERLGGAAILANDEFFAAKENLLKASAPVWREGEYTERGKWMDGWETRRRRSPGHDWCIVRLGLPGIIHGIVVDTSWFTGNYPESCSIEACAIEGVPQPAKLAEDDVAWREILPRSTLEGNTPNAFSIDAPERFTHLRLNIFPDGGVARLRVHGVVMPDWAERARPGVEVDLGALENGGLAVAASDMFYGNRQNLLLPGPALGMSDGWETKRRRGPGNDWVIVRLGARAELRRIVVDTSHCKGNAPGACSLDACDTTDAVPSSDARWVELVARTRLEPHTVHELGGEVRDVGAITHVRLNVFPDGGVARLRLFGATVPPD
ncbi:MAG: allantoicase [Longimicrobiales bacterium]